MVAPCGDDFISKLRKFRLSFAIFQYSNPSFPYISHYPLQIFHTCEKIRRSADHLCIFICIYYFFFLIFVCIKSHPSSDSGKISWKESKFKTMKRPNASDDEECGHKKLREQAVCELSSSQESSSTQSVKEILRPGIEQKRVQQNEESYSRSQVMLLFRIGLRSCQILVIFVKCGR